MCQTFKDPLYKVSDEELRGKALDVVTYLVRNRFRHQKYFYYFTMFEVVNFLNVIMQVYLVDEFLGGTFTTYGLDVLNYSQMEQDDRVDPMVRVFPRMTKCTFHRFGSSGDIQRYDALCILPLNIINEKIYIIMWFWFVFLALVTGLWLLYRLFTFLKPNIRYEVLKRRASLVDQDLIRNVLSRMKSGDWFIMYMMCKNMDSQWFRFIVKTLSGELKASEDEKRQRNGPSGARARARQFSPLSLTQSSPEMKEMGYSSV